MAEAKRVVGKCTGYICGIQNWTIVSFPVSQRGSPLHTFSSPERVPIYISLRRETPFSREATPDPLGVDISAQYYTLKTRQQGPLPSSLRGSSLANAQGQQGLLFGVGSNQSDLHLERLMMENYMFGGQTSRTGTIQEDPMLLMMQQWRGSW
ncbi:hypothetical protein B9Z19DRAFT_1133751 [Tuber borchii]|uniref:Uncharacterized protein n=1 Tax=Tuber borchii TaxID=42251 RepID=A0A2T6ZFF2_TUBBO|nr:hypothetical protein B9Z19DRAFT_1133751 [Tuber borchii]